MISEKENTLEGLRVAVQMEVDGKEFYLKASRESSNEMGRKLLESLSVEEDQHRQHQRDKRTRLDQVGLPTVQCVEPLQAHGEWPEVWLRDQVDQRGEEIVPREEEVEQDNRSDGRQGLWHDHGYQDAPRGGPVDHRSLIQVARDLQEVLPK